MTDAATVSGDLSLGAERERKSGARAVSTAIGASAPATLGERRFRVLLGFNVAVSALCIFTHLALNTAFSYVFQNTIFIYSLFVGVFLASMGLGVLVVQRIKIDRSRLIQLLLGNGVVVLLLANPGTFLVLYLNELLIYLLRSEGVDLLWVMFPVGLVLTALVGMAAGAELPVFSRLLEREDAGQDAAPLTGVLASDYLGSFVGTIAFAFLLFPSVGLVQSILIVQAVMVVVLDAVLLWFGSLRRPRNLLATLALNAYVFWSLSSGDLFLALLDQVSFW